MEQTKTILEKLNAGAYDERLERLYVDPARIPGQRKRYRRAVLRFEELFGPGMAEVYSAPGRSEVGGNHTDHQHGIVLAASVNLDAIAVVRRTTEPVIRILSEGYELVTVELSDLEKRAEEEGTTAALIRGMARRLSEHGFGAAGGFCAYVTSDVLIGAGLSSSAAFEVLVGTIISGLFYEGRIDPVAAAEKLKALGAFEVRTMSASRSPEKLVSGDTLPYSSGVYHFREGCGLYTIVCAESDAIQRRFGQLLDSLSYSGIGGKRSAGLGRFTVQKTDVPEDLLRRLNGNASPCVSLSVCMASDEELESVLEGARYLLLRRAGFVASTEYADEQRRKRDMYMFCAGSCFDRRFVGDVFDVSNGGRHAVYRYAAPLWMEI